MIAAFIMGRKKSKGFPGKNLTEVLGKPLAFYPMSAAKRCQQIDRVFLSTDDEGLMQLGRQNGVEIIVRPPELCTDGALGEDVYVHAYEHVKQRYENEPLELVVLLMCNAATVTPSVISEGISVLRENPEYDSAVTVSRYNMWSPLRARRIDEKGLLKPFVPFEVFGDPGSLNCDRDSQGDVWFADMGVSVIRPKCLDCLEKGLLPQKWMGKNIYPLKQWGGLDVDYEWQMPQVEYWLKKQGVAE
ncbi:MAG: cytidylyltransferase [Candidatus Omnitrophica bacterium]|nr:cytidylyltransferase [Candidatus Omnitrophota bacterium]